MNFLASFKADCSTGVSLLTWQVNYEEHLASFRVEQSVAGRQWTINDQQNSPIHSNSGKDFFCKVNPLSNAFYRVLCTDIYGAMGISASYRGGCAVQPKLKKAAERIANR